MRSRSLFLVLAASVSIAAVAYAQPDSGQAPLPTMSAAEGAAIQQALAAAAAEGFTEPNVTPALVALASASPEAQLTGDQALSAAAIALAAQEHGLADPAKIDANFALRGDYDAAKDFAAARADGRIAAWAASLAPADAQYAALIQARRLYAAAVAAGGWPSLPIGPGLKTGQTAPRVAALRQRLAAEGYVSPVGPDPNVFDQALAAQLAAFQANHGLHPTGVLDAKTLAALNTPADARLAQIDANLERARWEPRQLPPERIVVDIAGQTATLYQNNVAAIAMAAVVGKAKDQTPTLASKVTGVEFNPPWIVPDDIAKKELFPKERRSPGYFARNDIEVVNGQVIQKAGPKSALGYVKFDVPDAFQVYLHDTPARGGFANEDRFSSHGCVRLAKPRDLAAALLAPQGWNRAKVDQAIASGATTTVAVPAGQQPAVFLIYRTALVGQDGHVTFRADPYKWDAEVSAALAGDVEQAQAIAATHKTSG
jgi:murein L,D-transpeptidase YcbB/YkuD